jgi:hypothetical protein
MAHLPRVARSEQRSPWAASTAAKRVAIRPACLDNTWTDRVVFHSRFGRIEGGQGGRTGRADRKGGLSCLLVPGEMGACVGSHPRRLLCGLFIELQVDGGRVASLEIHPHFRL